MMDDEYDPNLDVYGSWRDGIAELRKRFLTAGSVPDVQEPVSATPTPRREGVSLTTGHRRGRVRRDE
jgi:hypothetical protein